MKSLSLFTVVATVVATVHAGNPAYLRESDSGSAGGINQVDFSDVDQADQTEQTASSLVGSGSHACPQNCTTVYQPVKDEAGEEYLNECLLDLAKCTGSTILTAAEMAIGREMFESGEGGTVGLTSSGSGGDEQVWAIYSNIYMLLENSRDRARKIDEALADGTPEPKRPSRLATFADILESPPVAPIGGN